MLRCVAAPPRHDRRMAVVSFSSPAKSQDTISLVIGIMTQGKRRDFEKTRYPVQEMFTLNRAADRRF